MHKRKSPGHFVLDMAVPIESVCGLWIDESGEAVLDKECGEKIANYIRKSVGRAVVKADVENISFVQVTTVP